MKIERVSENQLKLTLTKADLEEKGIRLSELMSPTEKTQQLFRDLMEHTLMGYDFVGNNVPLMVEASPFGTDGIAIIVTRMVNEQSGGTTTYDEPYVSTRTEPKRWKEKNIEGRKKRKLKGEHLFIYAFKELNEIVRFSLRVRNQFKGDSAVYKKNAQYFLILNNATLEDAEGLNILSFVLEEYGTKYIASPLSQSFLTEHGEVIIEKNAIESLSGAFGAPQVQMVVDPVPEKVEEYFTHCLSFDEE
ncbi:MAG: adaptor protein MecA [Bacillota bacterium]